MGHKKTFFGLEDLENKGQLLRWLVAEFIGTMLLLAVATGECTVFAGQVQRSSAEVAFTNGFIVTSLITALSHVSGCHINPAVSICLLISGHSSLVRTLLFIPVQLMGATVGSLIFKIITPEDYQGTLCATSVNPVLTPWQGVLAEAISTFILLLMVQVTNDPVRMKVIGNRAPLAVGLAVTTDLLWSNDYTGASMNPARSSGPAFASFSFNGLWVYWTGPILGGLAGTLFYKYVLKIPEKVE